MKQNATFMQNNIVERLDLTDIPHTCPFNKFPVSFLHKSGVGESSNSNMSSLSVLPMHMQITTVMLASRKPSRII